MPLEVLLLIISVVVGLLSAFAARFRREGTRFADLVAGATVGLTAVVFALVVLTIVVGLDAFGVIHLLYLVLVISVPIAFGLIVLPHHLTREYRTPIVAWLMTLAAIALPLVGLYGTHVEPNRLDVDEVALGSSGANRPIVLGVIADLQATGVGEQERRALDAIIEAEPDVVVLPGDLFQFDEGEFATGAPELVGFLRELRRAVDNVVIVSGEADTPDGIEAIAEDANVTYLVDAVAEIDLGRGQRVVIVGVEPQDDRSAVDPDLLDAVRANYTEDDLVLLLSHSPDPILSLTADDPFDLVIAGRTHGGQVSLPFIGPVFTASDVPRTVGAGGLHLVNDRPVYVSTGVGVERLQAPQLRLGVTPTIGVITIVPS